MSHTALIIEEDEKQSLKLAAILEDEGLVVERLKNQDLFKKIQKNTYQTLFLRHEKQGSSGMTLCSRIRKTTAKEDITLVLLSSDLSSEAIEKHLKQDYSADYCIRLPISRKEVTKVLESLEQQKRTYRQLKEKRDAEKQADTSSNAPNNPHFLHRQEDNPALSLSEADLKFVDQVFESLDNSPEHSVEILNTTISQEQKLSATERKVLILRRSLAEREKEMKQLKNIWQQYEDKYQKAASLFEAKDIRIEKLLLRNSELEEGLRQAQHKHLKQIETWGEQQQDNYESNALKEIDFIREIAIKEKQLNDGKRAHRKVEQLLEETQIQLSERIYEWERAYKQLEKHHYEVNKAGATEIKALDALIYDKKQQKHVLKTYIKALEENICRKNQKIQQQQQALFRAAHQAHTEITIFKHTVAWQFASEHHQNILLKESNAYLRARVFGLEEVSYKYSRLLAKFEKYRQSEKNKLCAQLITRDDQNAVIHEAYRDISVKYNELSSRYTQEMTDAQTVVHLLSEELEQNNWRSKYQKMFLVKNIEKLQKQTALQLTEFTNLQEHSAQTSQQYQNTEQRLLKQLQQQTIEKQNYQSKSIELEQQNRELNQKIQYWESRYISIEDAHNTLKEQFSLWKSEKNSLLQEYELQIKSLKIVEEEFSDRDLRLSRDLEISKHEQQTLRKTIEGRDLRYTELLSQLRKTDEQALRLEVENERLKNLEAESQANLQSFKTIKQQLEDRIQVKEREKEAILLLKLEEEKKQYMLKIELKRQADRYQLLEQQIAIQQENIHKLQQDLHAHKESLQQEQNKNQDLQNSLLIAQAEVSSSGLMIDELEKQLEKSEKIQDNMLKRLDLMTTELTSRQHRAPSERTDTDS